MYALQAIQCESLSQDTLLSAAKLGFAQYGNDDAIDQNWLSKSESEQAEILHDNRSECAENMTAKELLSEVQCGQRNIADTFGRLMNLENIDPDLSYYLVVVSTTVGEVSTSSKVLVTQKPNEGKPVKMSNVYHTAIEVVAHDDLEWESDNIASTECGSIAYRVIRAAEVDFEHVGILKMYLGIN